MTDPNNAQPPRHGVIKRTIGGSLARSWPPPLPRRRCCCVLLLLLLGLSAAAAAAANISLLSCYFCCVQCVGNFRLLCVCHSTPRALAYVNAEPPRHGVIKRTIGGSLHAGNALGHFGPGFRRGCVRQGARGVNPAVSRRAGPSWARNERKCLGEPVLLVFTCGITRRIRERFVQYFNTHQFKYERYFV